MVQSSRNNCYSTASGDWVCVIRHAEVCKKLKVSPSKLFSMIAAGHFPRPFKLVPGGRAVGWLLADVDEYVRQRARSVEESK
jgi:predicted DNA-binding transcriptional regulator AlpA